MTWKEAIITVLKAAGNPMTTKEITDQILEQGLRKPTPTPERTCATEAGKLVSEHQPGFDRGLVVRFKETEYEAFTEYRYVYVGLSCDDDDWRISYNEDIDLVEFYYEHAGTWRRQPVSVSPEHIERFVDALGTYRDDDADRNRTLTLGDVLREQADYFEGKITLDEFLKVMRRWDKQMQAD